MAPRLSVTWRDGRGAIQRSNIEMHVWSKIPGTSPDGGYCASRGLMRCVG